MFFFSNSLFFSPVGGGSLRRPWNGVLFFLVFRRRRAPPFPVVQHVLDALHALPEIVEVVRVVAQRHLVVVRADQALRGKEEGGEHKSRIRPKPCMEIQDCAPKNSAVFLNREKATILICRHELHT